LAKWMRLRYLIILRLWLSMCHRVEDKTIHLHARFAANRFQPPLTVGSISATNYGRGGGVGRVLGVMLGRGVGVGLAVGVGVAVGVTVGVAVGVGLGAAAQYLPPVFKLLPKSSCPPQTIISLPVHTAV
jgi:hypothetical protein